MAGTGHGYEISNISEVKAFQRRCADQFQGLEGFEGDGGWFFTRAFLRFATSDLFVFRIRKQNSASFLEASSDEERPFLVAKIEAGGDVRRFSADQFGSYGPDVVHAADYARHLGRTSPRLLRKAARMSPSDFFARVRRWVPSRARETGLPEGRIAQLFTTTVGRRWIELLDQAALRREGMRMSHCVGEGGYQTAEQGGSSRIFSLRDEDDRPLVTVEASSGRNVSIRQIKAFGNDPVARGARECVCELLDFLGATSNGEYLTYAQITLKNGRWAPIEKVWERAEIAGLDAMAEFRTAVLTSPTRPDVSLLRVSGEADWWKRGERRGLSAVMADQRTWNLDEVRAVARFVDEYGTNNPLAHGPRDQRIVEIDGRHVAFVDAIEKRSAGDVEYFLLPDGAVVVYQSSFGTVPLVEIGPLKDSRGDAATSVVYAMPCSPERWNATDARRCLVVMTEAGAVDMRASLLDDGAVRHPFLRDHYGSDAEKALKELKGRFELRRTPEGRWYSFVLDADRQEARRLEGHWLVGHDLLRLVVASGRPQAWLDVELSEGRVISTPYVRDDEARKEICEFLNRRKAECHEGFWHFRNPLTPKREAGRICHVGGRWRIIRSQGDLAAVFRSRKPQPSDAGAFAMLPISEEKRLKSCDAVFETLAPLWLQARLANKKIGYYVPTGAHAFSPETLDWDWQAVHWFVDNRNLLPAGLRKTFLRAMGDKLVMLAGASRGIGGSREQEEAGMLLRKLVDDLMPSFVEKAARAAFGRKSFFTFRSEDDLVWLDLVPRLEQSRTGAPTASRILDQARTSLYGVDRIDSVQKARVAAGCAVACGGRPDYFFASRMAEMRAKADELATRGEIEASEILAFGARLAEARRDALVEARRREREEWEKRYFPSRAA